MTSVEKVKCICKERKIPISRLEKDLGYANGYISQLKKGTFPDNRLVEIASYLEIETAYLTGEQKNTSPEIETGLTEDQRRAIEKIKKMSPEQLAKKMPALEAVLDI